MKIKLICVGKVREAAVRTLCLEYETRLKRSGPMEIQEVRAAKVRDRQLALAEEEKRILTAFEPGDQILVLDERGRSYTSRGLAKDLDQYEINSVKRLVVVLGGAYGLTESMRGKGRLLSLSKLTFPHDLCRLIILEQLYRARSIQRGEPYHHD